MTSQTQFETKLIDTLKKILAGKVHEFGGGVSPERSAGKACLLHQGKAEWKLIRAGWDSSVARKITEDCYEVALNETWCGA